MLSGYISITDNVQNSAADRDFASHKQIVESDAWHFHSLQKHFLDFLIIHFDGVISREVKKSVMSHEIGLGIVPLGFENIAFVFNGL